MTQDARRGRIASVNISSKKGEIKHPVPTAEATELGLADDAHAGPWHRQVTLLAQEEISAWSEKAGKEIAPGEFAENLTTEGIDLTPVQVLDRFRIGPVELETTQIGKTCHGHGCAIFEQVGQCLMPTRGIFTRVVKPGRIEAGAEIEFRPRRFKVRVITLSDRAAAGQYRDKTGPRIVDRVTDWLAAEGWRPEVDYSILPDETDQLAAALDRALEQGCDLVMTTGSTGVGPRDIAPEVVGAKCAKLVPGIMDMVRLKHGAEKPNALLTRAVAGVTGQTQFYTLPGSVRAVEEYLDEIFKTLDHMILMIHSIDAHAR